MRASTLTRIVDDADVPWRADCPRLGVMPVGAPQEIGVSAQPLAVVQPAAVAMSSLPAPSPVEPIREERILRTPSERAHSTELPSEIELPVVRPAPRDPWRGLAMRSRPGAPEASRYRALRARLRRQGDPRLIAIQGSGARAAASVTAANLALAFAETGRRVALVEGGGGLLAPLCGVTAPSRPALSLPSDPERLRRAYPDPRVDVLLPCADSSLAGSDPLVEEADAWAGLGTRLLDDYDYVLFVLSPESARENSAAAPREAFDAVLVVDDTAPDRIAILD